MHPHLRVRIHASRVQVCASASTRVSFIAIHVCTHDYPYEQVVLRVPAEVNASKVTRISCAGITTRDFLSSSNRAVPYKLTIRS